MSQHTLAHWQALSEGLRPEGRAFINGCYCNAIAGERFASVNPATGQPLAEVASCDEQDANLAVAHARTALPHWAGLAPAERKQVLLRFADLVEQHAEELALLETLDMGKPISNSLEVDLPAAVRCLRWNAEAIDKVYGEIAPTAASSLGLVTREPLGVVAAIVPWNFPLMMACWKIAPALAAGNTVILKPSEKSPLSALRLAALAHDAGLPAGVLQVLPGYGHTVGKALALHMDVNALAFTGSTGVGKRLTQYAGESNLKRTFMECGGKSANIVFADAGNLDRVAQQAAQAIFYNQGEVCIAGSRLLVENAIKDELVERIVHHAAAWQPGNPLDPTTTMGAIVDATQLDGIAGHVAAAHKQGARLRTGGEPVSINGGLYFAPTVFDNVDNNMALAREEVFGPVLAVIGFDSADEAVAIANDSPYGLAAAVWTQNLDRALTTARRLESGQVFVNNYAGGDMTVPFGGYKQSGNGRDKSLHSLAEYSQLKTTWIEFGAG
ncbi:aldehyde dehydrogenase family protein [Oceanimonas sp. GK1]|uniref:aldehyde dehydrogenase n=1 Tax=Oceanimonas sp. (strain GK1 / IBRC-M 10197) TaxID=511062 RepID=UPI0002494AE4|nr:aldehyde dehydrogenase [Oceanimonas sp. GK1]AEX99795.1 aldehyde dehydrogenase family protein [Oceanimonas sp. GK1]